MKKIALLFFTLTAAFALTAAPRGGRPSRPASSHHSGHHHHDRGNSGVRLAADIIDLISAGLSLTTPPVVAPVPVAPVPVAPAAPPTIVVRQPVAPGTTVVAPQGGNVIVEPVRMYPFRRSLKYQTPGHVPPQRGVVYVNP